MKEDLIALVNEIPQIELKFHTIATPQGMANPFAEVIYDIPEFIKWREAVFFELQDIYDRTNDTYVWKLINVNGIINKFNGKNLGQRNRFEELKSALQNITKNIDKYYPKLINSKGNGEKMKKTKIFISHSSNDLEFVNLLVELLADIGLNNDNLFCSSAPDYGIPLGKNIYDYLASLFYESDLYVIFVLSQNYYNSVACLNEMGAAWVLRNDYTAILLPEFDYKEIKGAVNPNNIGLKLNDSNELLKKRLNELKDIIASKVDIKVPEMRWESKRNAFVENVKRISNI